MFDQFLIMTLLNANFFISPFLNRGVEAHLNASVLWAYPFCPLAGYGRFPCFLYCCQFGCLTKQYHMLWGKKILISLYWRHQQKGSRAALQSKNNKGPRTDPLTTHQPTRGGGIECDRQLQRSSANCRQKPVRRCTL